MAEIKTRLAQAAFYVALAVALLGAIALPAMAAGPRMLLTITDGPVQVLRGGMKFEAAEGLLLADDDIVRTAPSARLARIEFADGRVLDLGPATQAMLLSERTAQAQGWAGATAVVAHGWAKLSAGAAAGRLVMPHGVATGEARGVLLMQTAANGTALAFAESRGLTLRPRGAGAEVLLHEGETWSRDGASGMVRVASRHAVLGEVPRALADSLPRRAARFDGGGSEPTDGQPIDAADLAAWSRAEPGLVAQLTPRQRGRSGGTAIARAPSAVKAVSLNTARRAPVRTARAATAAPATIVASGLPLPATVVALGDSPALELPPTALLAAEPVLSSTRITEPPR